MNLLIKCSRNVFLFYIIWMIIGSAYSQERVESVSPSVDGTYTHDILLRWKVSTLSNTEQIKRFLVFYHTKKQIIEGDSTKQTVITDGFDLFDNRIKVSFQDGFYKVTIQNLQYKDIGTYRLTMGYNTVNSANVPYYESSDIRIAQIYGGPDVLNASIPQTIGFDENTTPTLSIEVQGNPEPTVSVQFAGKTIPTNSFKKRDYHVYEYTYVLPKLEAKHCGKVQTYDINGYHGSISQRFVSPSSVYVIFTPSPISEVRIYKSQNKCIATEWNLLNTGNCEVLYSLQYSNNGYLLRTVELNLKYKPQQKYTYETCDIDLTKSTEVVIWSTYKDKQGPKSFAVMSSSQDTKSGSSCWLIAGPIIGLIIVLVMIFIVLVYAGLMTISYNGLKGCICRRNKYEEPLAMPEHHNEL